MKPTAKTLLEVERFFAHVDKQGNDFKCWIWKGARKGGRGGQKYGSFRVGSRRKGGGRTMELAHRWSYRHHFGNLTSGMVIHHNCDNGLCVNPAHLKEVTVSANYWAST